MNLTNELLQEALDEAMEICTECFPDFIPPVITKLEISKARSYWAQIRCQGIHKYAIRISNVFNEIPDGTIARVRLRSAMTHELIHTQRSCMNHGKYFQRKAQMINKKYPELKIGTSTTTESVGLPPEIVHYRYSVICTKCGAVSKYQRKPNIWKYVNLSHSPYTCTDCNNDSFRGEQHD